MKSVVEPEESSTQPQMTSAQLAAQKLKELNTMELKVSTDLAPETEDCEIFGGEFPDVDIDLQNQQNLYFSQQNMVSKVSTSGVADRNAYREIVNDPINFQSSIAKFTQVSEEEIEHRAAVKRSRQAVIAGRLLRIRGEMRMLENQLKTNEQQ